MAIDLETLMAIKSSQKGVADKATLDVVKETCDDIYDIVSQGGGGGGSLDLSKVKVYIGDFRADTINVISGGLSGAGGYITT